MVGKLVIVREPVRRPHQHAWLLYKDVTTGCQSSEMLQVQAGDFVILKHSSGQCHVLPEVRPRQSTGLLSSATSLVNCFFEHCQWQP